jgi:STE24 endopeptidase
VWHRSYRLERRYAISQVSIGAWVRDYITGAMLAVAAAAAAGELVHTALRISPAWGWIGAALSVAALAALTASIVPLAIAPLFHRMRPLDRPALRARLRELSERAGIGALDVHEWGLGERTRRAGAALVGIGPTRRIVVSSTLLADYSDDEIEVILAHEIGHHVHRDVLESLGAECGVLLAGFGAAFLLLRVSWQALGLSGPSDVAGLPLAALAVAAASLAARPLLNALSRRSERRADRFALAMASQPGAFVAAIRRMADQNMVEDQPTRAVLWMFHAHPSVQERIASARTALNGAGMPAADRAGSGAREPIRAQEPRSPVPHARV